MAPFVLCGVPVPHVSATSTRYVFIRFDDGYQTQFVNAIPVLQQYGYKASYLGIAANIDSANATPGIIHSTYESVSWSEITTLRNKGYEIVDHGNYEADMNSLSSSQLSYEIATSRQDFLNHGFTNLPDFALPEGTGFTNQTVLSTIYNAGFKHAWGAYVPYGVSNHNTLKVQFYPEDWIDNYLSVSAFESQVSQASGTYVVGL